CRKHADGSGDELAVLAPRARVRRIHSAVQLQRCVAELQGAQAVASGVGDEEQVAVPGCGCGEPRGRGELAAGDGQRIRRAGNDRKCGDHQRCPRHHGQLPASARRADREGSSFGTSINATRHSWNTLTARQAEPAFVVGQSTLAMLNGESPRRPTWATTRDVPVSTMDTAPIFSATTATSGGEVPRSIRTMSAGDAGRGMISRTRGATDGCAGRSITTSVSGVRMVAQ